MEQPRPGPYSYIVRVWIEQEDDGSRLRGHIDYVAVDESPSAHSFTDLDVIPVFIRSHLRSIGVNTGGRRSTRHWLACLRGSR